MSLLEYQIKSNKKKVVVECKGRTAVISCPTTAFVKEEVVDNTLIGIKYEDDVTFRIGDELKFRLGTLISPFKIVEIIKNDEPGKYYINCSHRTLSTYFLLPLLAKTRFQNHTWWSFDKYLINSYIQDDASLILIFRYFNTVDFSEFEDKLKCHESYIGFFDPNHYTVGFRFFIGTSHLEDFEFFKKGKYSKMSEIAIKKILEFYRHTGLHNHLSEVLLKSDKKRKNLEERLGMKLPDDIDVYSKPNLELEYYEQLI